MSILPTASLIPSGGGLGLNLNRVPFPRPGVRFRFSFNTPELKAALGGAKTKSLRRVGYKLMGTARKSIRKMGNARPRLKVMKTYGNLSLSQIAALPGMQRQTRRVARNASGQYTAGGGRRQSGNGEITEGDRRKIQERIREVQTKPPSAAGTPPHTHTGIMRRDIVFDYDRTSESVVVGSFMAGGAWLASLHEFGGMQRMRAWAFIPKYPGRYTGILAWYRHDRGPKRRANWAPTGFQETFPYPARPYMSAAMYRLIGNGGIASEFRNSFRIGGR